MKKLPEPKVTGATQWMSSRQNLTVEVVNFRGYSVVNLAVDGVPWKSTEYRQALTMPGALQLVAVELRMDAG